MVVRKSIIILWVFLLIPYLYAGTTGKIAGIVNDKQTGEALPGVNVLLEGTTLGASTDIDGYYVIVNVPIGVHELRVTYIGYKDVLIYNVRVVADATSRHDFEMEPTLLEVSEVIEVFAERELIAMDNTASRTIITDEVIASQPVDNIIRTVGLTAGSTEGSFRGGRVQNGEVKYLIDGVDISNPIATVNRGYLPGDGNADMATDIPEAAMAEVQVITGGMDARYDAKSAVVNIVTKSGGKRYSGYMRTKMTPSEFGNGNIIPYDLGQVSGYRSQDWAIQEAKQVGTGSKYVNDDYYAPPAKYFMNNQFRRYELGFGGPIPMSGLGVEGNMSFNISVDFFDTGGWWRGMSNNQKTYNAKLVYNTASNSSFSFTYLYSNQKLTNYGHRFSRIVSTGDTLYGYNAGSEFPDKVLVGSVVHPDGTLEAVTDYDMLNNITRPEYNSNLASFVYKSTVSSKTFYEIGISRFYTEQKRRVYDPATGMPLGLDDFRTQRFTDPANSDYFPEGAPTAQLLESYWWIQPMVLALGRQNDKQTVWTIKADLVSQLNEFNELRVGVEYKYYDLYMDFQSLASGQNEYTSFFDNLHPNKLSIYVEDKIETDGMIINAGLRFDYFDPNAILPENFQDPLVDGAKDPNNPLYLNARAPADQRIKNPTDADTRFRISPRIGISFPITERDVFHVNYGHYFGMPNMGNLYDNYTWSMLGQYKYLGNPNLEHEKIISYEAGIQHGFSDDIKLTVTGFFKDIADLVNKQKYIDGLTGAPYWVNVNRDYANVKGFEASLQTRRWYNSILSVAYTYSTAKGKNSSAQQSFQDDYDNRRPRTDEFFLDWDVRHTISANFDYRIPQDYFGNAWFDDMGANVILTYNSGKPYTSANTVPPPNLPAVNDKRYPGWLNVDIRLFKNFAIYETLRFGVFFEVFNLFNDRTVRDIENPEQYDLGFDIGDGTQNTPINTTTGAFVWAPPRQMRLGFEMRF